MKEPSYGPEPYASANSAIPALVDGGGFEPPKSLTADLQSAPFGRSGTHPCDAIKFIKVLELVMGLEPATC